MNLLQNGTMTHNGRARCARVDTSGPVVLREILIECERRAKQEVAYHLQHVPPEKRVRPGQCQVGVHRGDTIATPFISRSTHASLNGVGLN